MLQQATALSLTRTLKVLLNWEQLETQNSLTDVLSSEKNFQNKSLKRKCLHVHGSGLGSPLVGQEASSRGGSAGRTLTREAEAAAPLKPSEFSGGAAAVEFLSCSSDLCC